MLRSRSHTLLVFILVLASACGGARTRTPRPELAIDELRKRAAAEPRDQALWTELTIAEHLSDGGDPELAREALAHTKTLGAPSLRLVYIEAEQHVLEGRPRAAFDAFSSLLERAASDSDPMAPLLAEAALGALSDMNDAVDDYRPRLVALLDKLRPKAAALGLTAAHQLRMQLLGQALARGDLRSAEQLASESGCVREAQVAGPFGPRDLLGFDRALPPEAPGPLADKYDLGPGRGEVPTRKLSTRRCLLGLGRGARDAWPGASVVRSELEVPKAGDYALRFESPNSLAIWLDGKELTRVDLRAQPAFGVRYIPLTLPAGKHELKVKISSRHPNPVLSLALVQGDADAIARVELPEANDSFSRYVGAKLALSRGNGVAARELLRKLGQSEPSAHWLVLSAAAALADPLRPAELRRDSARDLLRKASARNAHAWYPVVGLANLEAAEGRSKEAIESLRTAQEQWPEVISIRTSLIDQLRERGYGEEADRRTAELEQLMPNACAVTHLALTSARARGRMGEVARLTERVMACDASSTARFGLAKVQRKYQQAAEELVRLRLLSDGLDEGQRIESELEEALIAGDLGRARALREERSRFWPDRPGPVLDRADMLLAAGDRAGAIAHLSRGLEQHPSELHDIRRVHEALGGQALFEGFRKDGGTFIANFEASGKSYSEPQVLVLDYTVVRIFEDGSSADLTHNIIRVQSQEAVDDNGEFSVPDGARVLTLHTVKADGTRLEPEAIAGKSTLSLPNLAPGDYVEFEMTRGEAPSMGFPGGYLGNRFYFKSFEIPFHHSELVVVLPAGMEPVLDPRGPAPKTQRETKDGLTILRWSAHESRPLSPEAMSVASREYLPSINLGVKVTWEAYVESLRDLLSDKDVVDPAAKQAVQELLGEAIEAPPSVRAAKIYRWVTDQIEPTDDVFGLAPAMLSARTGHRERVLKYMLSLAGVESELVLARGVDADHSEALLPDLETYGYLLVRAQTEKGPVWLHSGARHAPFGYLPPQVRGEIALVLDEAAERVTVPQVPLEADLRSVDAEITLAPNGTASVHVRETHRGSSAVGWRNDLDEIPAAELEARFEESYASSVFPGARLKSLTIEGREDPERPLVVDYQLTVDSLGQRTDHEQRIPALLPSSLAAQFARQATRTTTELIPAPQVMDVRVRVALPAGAKVLSAPRTVQLEHPLGAHFSGTTQVSAAEAEIKRSLRLPVARIKPEAYAQFAEFCRAVDLSEAAELVVQLP